MTDAPPPRGPGLDADGIRRFLERHFPQALEFPLTITAITPDELTCELAPRPEFLRPGGTISGPTLMTLADTATYFLLLSRLGPVALAVTTSLHIDFLRRPAPGPILARAELLKLGRTLAVMRVVLTTAEAPDSPVAHATVTYALPPDRLSGP